jgi:hypothetical protein
MASAADPISTPGDFWGGRQYEAGAHIPNPVIANGERCFTDLAIYLSRDPRRIK